jgi:prolyl-tRNA editing enzyme YbaK/EbsC (Cys-tRNA(Pro) deacylase)
MPARRSCRENGRADERAGRGGRLVRAAPARPESATAEADALGVPADDVAKTLVVTTPEGYVRAVVPASCRLDVRKLRELRGAGKKAAQHL